MKFKKFLFVVLFICFISLITSCNLLRERTEFDPDNADLFVTIKVVDEAGSTVINDKLSFTEGETVYQILERNYTLETRNDYGSIGVLSINDVKTDWVKSYLSIMINGEYAATGLDATEAKDGMLVELVWTDMSIW